MGIMRFMGTLLKHPVTKDALSLNVPVFECLLVDYNGNIHYILQKTIMELNEILYFTYQRENNPTANILNDHLTESQPEYNFDSDFTIEDVEDLIDRYNDEYAIGTTYQEISLTLSSDIKIYDILFAETINYTRKLICSVNKGWIKKVYLALDGVPSMAKIKEQKNRRYIGTYINNIRAEIVAKYKLINNDILQVNLFRHRSSICAGSKFMEKIQKALFNLDIGLDIEVSTIDTKGEGEKKIIHFMDEHTKYDSYCIMSPDSDMLILAGLLRNNSAYENKKLYNFRIDYQNKNEYQFFDLKKLVENLQIYYSAKIYSGSTQIHSGSTQIHSGSTQIHSSSNKLVGMDKMLDMFFMLVVFGNDFLPKLEPLDITMHFDFVCETCLRLSANGLKFVENGKLNYTYLLEFFRLINQKVIDISVEHWLNTQYHNYQSLCKQMSVTENDLRNNHHHSSMKPIVVNYTNFSQQMHIIISSYQKFIDFMRGTNIKSTDIRSLFLDIHNNINDSYFMLVLPKLVRFPGFDRDADSYDFFKKLIEYIASTKDFDGIKLRTKLMTRKYEYQQNNFLNNTTAYLIELEKLNKSMEPYRTMFHLAPINLVTFDLKTSKITDLRDKYYQTYIKADITKKEIDMIVEDYLVGIEWLYQYYITGKHLEWSGWFYNYTQPPLIDDIIKYLTLNPSCQTHLDSILNTYPENNLTPGENHSLVTPNDYTHKGISPNLADVIHLIDGNGVLFLNKCQIKWHEYQTKS